MDLPAPLGSKKQGQWGPCGIGALEGANCLAIERLLILILKSSISGCYWVSQLEIDADERDRGFILLSVALKLMVVAMLVKRHVDGFLPIDVYNIEVEVKRGQKARLDCYLLITTTLSLRIKECRRLLWVFTDKRYVFAYCIASYCMHHLEVSL
uniref:Uncharacterized protein n=1 Tax=Chenopodium quinoa TaxID=63459 RepID=A0A803MY74_CHEQI